MWGNYTWVRNNPFPWYGQTMANWMLATTMCLHTFTATLLIVWATITGQGLNPTAAQGAKICLLLQRLRAVSWCLMRIIHSALVQGWGGLVFHIVESLVFSAHIMKWDCHPAMRPLCSRKQTWRTCCWSNKDRRTSERVRPHVLWIQEVGKASWVQEKLKKKWVSLAYAVKVRSGKTTTTDTNTVKLKQNVHYCSELASKHT